MRRFLLSLGIACALALFMYENNQNYEEISYREFVDKYLVADNVCRIVF
jgi:hypothetical protein